jgi:hypothetical protein
MQETGFGTGSVGAAKSGKAAGYVYVDNNVLATEGARTFEHDSTVAAWSERRCQDVKEAQVLLITMSSIQFFLGLITSYAMAGIFPLVSIIFGLVSSIQYFRGTSARWREL